VSAERSPSADRPFGVLRTCRLLDRSRSGLYSRRKRLERPALSLVRRGPKTAWSDAELTERIRGVLTASPFVGEGHRKIWARLRIAEVRTSKARVLRLMREANLLAPVRAKRVLGPRVHDGTIVTERPDVMWGTDATAVWTSEEGLVSVFAAIDHCTAECVGSHAAKRATRFEALEPIRQGVRDHFGVYAQSVAAGLTVRHDHGSQYVSDHFQAELAFLRIASSPAFVRSPEGNGCIERFFRTLKEQLLWVKTFRNAEEVRLAVGEWIKLYNEHWLIERLGHRSPAEVRRSLLTQRIPA
jgi:transposase InsO family protein